MWIQILLGLLLLLFITLKIVFRLLSILSIFNICASEKNHLYCFLFQIIKCYTWTSLFHLDATRKMNSINLLFTKRHNRIQMSLSEV